MLREGRIESRLQHMQDALLDESVEDGGDRGATLLGFALATTASADFSLHAWCALQSHAALSGMRRDLPTQ